MDLNSKFLKAFPNFTNVSQRKKVVKPLAPASSIGRQANHADLIPHAPVSSAARNHAKNHRNKRAIVGQAPSCELLEVVPSNKFLHTGRAHVRSDSVCEYVANKLGVDTATIIRAIRSCALITVKQTTTSAGAVVVCFARHSSNAER